MKIYHLPLPLECNVRLRKTREMLGASTKDFARVIHLSDLEYQRMEVGLGPLSRIDAVLLADHAHLSLHHLLFGIGPPLVEP